MTNPYSIQAVQNLAGNYATDQWLRLNTAPMPSGPNAPSMTSGADGKEQRRSAEELTKTIFGMFLSVCKIPVEGQSLILAAIRGVVDEVVDQSRKDGKLASWWSELPDPKVTDFLQASLGMVVGVTEGLVSPLTGLFSLAVLGEHLSVIASKLGERALIALLGGIDLSPEVKKLTSDWTELKAQVKAYFVDNQNQGLILTLLKLPEKLSKLAEATAYQLGRKGGGEIVSELIGAEENSQQAAPSFRSEPLGWLSAEAESVQRTIVKAPWAKVGNKIGYAVGFALINVVLIIGTGGIGILIGDLGDALAAFGKVLGNFGQKIIGGTGRMVKTAGTVVSAIERLIVAVQGQLFKFKPFKPIAELMEKFLKDLGMFFRKILGLASEEVGGAAAGEAARILGARSKGQSLPAANVPHPELPGKHSGPGPLGEPEVGPPAPADDRRASDLGEIGTPGDSPPAQSSEEGRPRVDQGMVKALPPHEYQDTEEAIRDVQDLLDWEDSLKAQGRQLPYSPNLGIDPPSGSGHVDDLRRYMDSNGQLTAEGKLVNDMLMDRRRSAIERILATPGLKEDFLTHSADWERSLYDRGGAATTLESLVEDNPEQVMEAYSNWQKKRNEQFALFEKNTARRRKIVDSMIDKYRKRLGSAPSQEALSDFAVYESNLRQRELVKAKIGPKLTEAENNFATYVEKILTNRSGQYGELLAVEELGADSHILKGPGKEKSVNDRGTDMLAYVPEDVAAQQASPLHGATQSTGYENIILINDNKAYSADVTEVSSMEKNFLKNLKDDIGTVEKSLAPADVKSDAVERMRAALKELEAAKDPRTRKLILEKYGIVRSVTTFNGKPGVGLNQRLKDSGFIQIDLGSLRKR